MRALSVAFLVLGLSGIGALAPAQDVVFFEEQFSGPNLDSTI